MAGGAVPVLGGLTVTLMGIAFLRSWSLQQAYLPTHAPNLLQGVLPAVLKWSPPSAHALKAWLGHWEPTGCGCMQLAQQVWVQGWGRVVALTSSCAGAIPHPTVRSSRSGCMRQPTG
jgi:hypothetical protein